MKTCGKCRIQKDFAAFHNASASKDGKHWICKVCSNEQAKYAARKIYEIRDQILVRYGNGTPHCNCCGELEKRFLVIDHLYSDGKEERKKDGLKGLKLWRKIIKEDYPKKYQILCYNCNMAKLYHGMCPHKLQKLKLNL